MSFFLIFIYSKLVISIIVTPAEHYSLALTAQNVIAFIKMFRIIHKITLTEQDYNPFLTYHKSMWNSDNYHKNTYQGGKTI